LKSICIHFDLSISRKNFLTFLGTSILFKTPSVIYFHDPFWIDFWIKTLANVLGLAHKEREREREKDTHTYCFKTPNVIYFLNSIQVCFDLWISHKFLTFCKGWEKMNVFLMPLGNYPTATICPLSILLASSHPIHT